MRELDNIRVADLPILLTKQTTLARYASLIPLREEPGGMRERIARYLAASGEPRSVPFRKELCTQIAAARALPGLAFPTGRAVTV